MRNILAKAGLAALIALGAVSATAGSAAAGADFGVGIYIGEPGYYPGERHGWRDRHERHDRYERHERRQYRPCNPARAVEKARWNGLRHARVRRVTQHSVVVSGYRYGERDRMVFANVRGCPITRY
ncbi:hypothetical protein [Brevundimonas sp.]|uniref:hypothetical protein n=1 Tax=Brevundimonas sp. TaxID=1871086 RepID=UPI0011D0D4FB|nr:hypothetical protein [Brevundimonas sp.]MBD3838005.1 hypothetical protein [Brevundimonas sp.]